MTKRLSTIAMLALSLPSVSSSLVKREEGQTLAEYALILALIAVVVVGIVIVLGGKIANIFTQISTSI